jgi:hypothetical protein
MKSERTPAHACRSSRRKEAPFFIAASGLDRFEPPYVGCYRVVEFQPERDE